mmetsp:Transcript_6841/g.12635  ORF Transcript_6841/g.12635 Transcript_6841/m.12635 type:complete len:273 (+) Transcript_6841:881-1699(+)
MRVAFGLAWVALTVGVVHAQEQGQVSQVAATVSGDRALRGEDTAVSVPEKVDVKISTRQRKDDDDDDDDDYTTDEDDDYTTDEDFDDDDDDDDDDDNDAGVLLGVLGGAVGLGGGAVALYAYRRSSKKNELPKTFNPNGGGAVAAPGPVAVMAQGPAGQAKSVALPWDDASSMGSRKQASQAQGFASQAAYSQQPRQYQATQQPQIPPRARDFDDPLQSHVPRSDATDYVASVGAKPRIDSLGWERGVSYRQDSPYLANERDPVPPAKTILR